MLKLQRQWEEETRKLGDIGLPDSLEWADQNVPGAREYLEKTYSEATKSIYLGNEGAFSSALEKYTKAWLRLWQLMAVDHYKKNDIMDVDMRYYRHLPDGYSMRWDSRALGKKFVVYPRKPKTGPEDGLWMTAGELVRIHENPSVFDIMKKFDAWIDRDVEARDKSMLEKILEHERKNPPPEKLKAYRKDKHGFQWYK